MTKITCDNCKEELENIFAGDEFEGKFLCSKCLRKSDYIIYRSLTIQKIIEFTYKIDFHFNVNEEEINKIIREIEVHCDLCHEYWRVKESEIEDKLKEHFQYHKKQMEDQQWLENEKICDKCKKGKMIFLTKEEKYCEVHHFHYATISTYQCSNKDCNELIEKREQLGNCG